MSSGRRALPVRQAARRAEQRTGLTKEQWQRSVGPYISEVLAAGEHPMLARRVLEAAEPDPDAEFEFGLDCVLDGLAARVGHGPVSTRTGARPPGG
ncbi:TetR/AcrR family transcriptional regulator C-terminal domain-containing protein [Saccharothrix tamanrassetensis]|uniref:TetR/AcrR family transcriptional regulator C-terminal domain-containing protein n=1 Tax=Saccharothrix tamanrassetensis TaxID=1051531 RepID=UPI0028AEB93E|nr:TetR/AcrR family transcriptional regulator C-terminal domain-containing protein [Saccharothrix tamanrassetensis]